MEDKKLIKCCQDGDKQAFNELIRKYYPYVTGFLLKMTCDEGLTEDLTQETFLKIIQKIELFDLKKNVSFGTYLITMAKNTFIDYCRKNKAVTVDIDDVQLSSETGCDDEVLDKMQAAEFEKNLEKIPPEQAQALKLKYYENMTLEQIAEVSGVASKTVKSRIHEGKVKLRKILRKESCLL